MDKMYFLYFSIVALAFIFNVIFITKDNRFQSEVGVGPVVQLVFTVPIFIVSIAVYFFAKNSLSHGLLLLLPFILEIIYFLFTKDLFQIFKADSGDFLIRSYVYSIGLATFIIEIINWL